MALPVVIPNTFANANASIPLSQLDNNFSTVAVAINGMANGAEALSNVNITGGSIANASLSNVSISSGNVTINVANVTTLDATNVEVTNIKAKDGTASATIADSTGVMTIGSSVLTTTDINGGTVDNTSIGATTPSTGAFTTLSASGVATFSAGSAAAPAITTSGDTNTGIFFPAADTIAFTEGGAEAMRLDSSGNLGLGVTPSAWDTNSKNLQLTAGSLYSYTTAELAVSYNAHYTQGAANWTYTNTQAASRYAQASGAHKWYISTNTPSAGDPISFTQAMTLDASGRLGLGATSLTYSAEFQNSINSDVLVRIRNTNSLEDTGLIIDGNNGGQREYRIGINTIANSPDLTFSGPTGYQWYVGGTERMRIDSSGNLLIGSPTYTRRLSVKDTTNTVVVIEGSNSGSSNINFADSDSENPGSINYAHATNYMAFQTAGAERARIDSSGNLLVGTTALGTIGSSSGAQISTGGEVYSSSTADSVFARRSTDGTVITFRRDTTSVGSISVTTTATAYNTSSDYRLKNVTGPIKNSGAYIDSLNPVEGTWKADGSPFVGLIAHEVQEVSRTQVVTGEKDGEEMQGMDYSNAEIIANLIAEVKSLRSRIAALEAK